MKKLVLIVTSLFLVAACTSENGGSTPAYSPSEVMENEFIFKGDQKAVESEMKKLNAEVAIDPLRKEQKIYRASYSGPTSFKQIAAKLEGKVEWVEPNFKMHGNTIESRYEWPEDKYFFYQYALNNIGQSAPWGLPGKSGADMKVLEAWKAASTAEEVVVAVIDSGVDYKHSDLKMNMWVNPKEAPKNGGIAGRDEDGNGYVDDIHGFDFVSSNRVKRWYGKKGDFDPFDDGGHGTHVAGAIAAANNHKGVVGVNPNAKIMAVKVLDGNGGGNFADLVQAVYYAVDMKADIMSLSLGSSASSKALEEAFNFAESKGVLAVIAAGNDGKNIDIAGNESYPASLPNKNILVVGASDNQDNPAGFSNYGYEAVDVFAPGVDILSTYPQQCKSLPNGKVCEDAYMIMSGTSMATPYVSGVASLVLASDQSLKGNPQAMIELLKNSSDKVPALFGKAASNGRVNALAAVQKAGSNKQPVQWLTNASVKVDQKRANDQLVDIRVPITQPGAKALRIHFDFVDIDDPYDNLYIYDKNWKLVSKFEKGHSRDHWSPIVIGDTAYVRFANSKIKKVGGKTNSVATSSKDMGKCLAQGGENVGPVIRDEITVTDQFFCAMDSMDIAYEDINKNVDDPNVFFNFNSDGFSIDKIEYTENEI